MRGLRFLRVGLASSENKPTDISFNTDNIIKQIDCCYKKRAGIVIMPRLYLTCATCGDLFYNKNLLDNTKNALLKIAKATKDKDIMVLIGFPIASEKVGNLIYDAVVVICKGEIERIIVPKKDNRIIDFLYKSFDNSELKDDDILLDNEKNKRIELIAGNYLSLFFNDTGSSIKLYLDFADEDKLLGVNKDYNESHINIFMGAIPSRAGMKSKLLDMIKTQSEALNNACIFVNAPDTESTTDYVFNGELCAAQNGELLANNFENEETIVYADIDITALYDKNETRLDYKYFFMEDKIDIILDNSIGINDTNRRYSKSPYLPVDINKKLDYLSDIIDLQCKGLKKRLESIGMKKIVVGVSGGLDSTIALLSAVEAFTRMRLNLSNIIAVQMPGFGSSKTTKSNSSLLCKSLGVTTRTIDITTAVSVHLKDIGHEIDNYNVTFENAQARYRTYLLMDIANDEKALVLGTGDLSEIALGFCTYNGDHMAMYGLNNSLPKTVLKELIRYISDDYRAKNRIDVANVLMSIYNTPISPELIPTNEEKEIVQKTEELIGPYELHDFFLYYFVKCHYSVREIFELSAHTFREYSKRDIVKYMRIFYKRFFNSQFKRSCSYDAPSVLSFSLSPRGCFLMPSDVNGTLWQEELDRIEAEL